MSQVEAVRVFVVLSVLCHVCGFRFAFDVGITDFSRLYFFPPPPLANVQVSVTAV